MQGEDEEGSHSGLEELRSVSSADLDASEGGTSLWDDDHSAVFQFYHEVTYNDLTVFTPKELSICL